MSEGDRKVKLRLIGGSTERQRRIAMSFVHPLGRLDVEARAVLFVEVNRDPYYATKRAEIERVEIAIGLNADARAKLYVLTSQIVASDRADLPLKIFVGDRCVMEPVLRETLGTLPTIFISFYGLVEARAHAAILMSRCVRPSLSVVGGSACADFG